MDHQFEIMFVTRLFLMLVIERFVRVFFDKRRTGFPVMALSYLALPLGLTAGVVLLGFLGEKPIVPTMILQTVPAVALLYVITLNYEGSWKKRLVASFSIFAIMYAIGFAVILVFRSYLAIYVIPARQSGVPFMLENIASLLLSLMVALLLQNFKHLRKSTAVLPAVWVSVLAIPLASIAVMFLVAFAVGYPPLSRFLSSASCSG